MPAEIHPALQAGRVAVITGAASGIGRAAALRLGALGMKVVLVDLPGDQLDSAAADIEAAGGAALMQATDVSDAEAMARLRETVSAHWGAVSVLMNNAATGANPGEPWMNTAGWKALLDVNLWGVINGVQAFVPSMIAAGEPALVINTGSKQGITSPPGNPAYNLSKAAVRSYTESLAHGLRESCGDRLRAHLLIPGYTFTGMTGQAAKPDAAWSAGEVVDFMLGAIARGEFYILCPDNAVDRATDERRMQWAMGDIIENRPALSRWHPDYKAAFDAFMAKGRSD